MPKIRPKGWWRWRYLVNPRFYFDIIGPWTPFAARHERVMEEHPPPWGTRVYDVSRKLKGKLPKKKETDDAEAPVADDAGSGRPDSGRL